MREVANDPDDFDTPREFGLSATVRPEEWERQVAVSDRGAHKDEMINLMLRSSR